MYIFFSNDLDLDLNLMPLLVYENIPIKMFYTIQYVYFCMGRMTFIHFLPLLM